LFSIKQLNNIDHNMMVVNNSFITDLLHVSKLSYIRRSALEQVCYRLDKIVYQILELAEKRKLPNMFLLKTYQILLS